jgi:hypothetical protein
VTHLYKVKTSLFSPGGFGKMGRSLAIVDQVPVLDGWISNVGRGCSSFDKKNVVYIKSGLFGDGFGSGWQ